MQLPKIQNILWHLMCMRTDTQNGFMPKEIYLRIKRLYVYIQRDIHKFHIIEVK